MTIKTKVLPAKLRAFLKLHPNLTAARDTLSYSDVAYTIKCKGCKADVWLKAVSYEGAEFNFQEKWGFSNRKLNIIDTEIDLRCECPNKTYATPDDFEISW